MKTGSWWWRSRFYRDLFKKQVSIFEETMAEARKDQKSFDTAKLGADTAKAQVGLTKAAFEKRFANARRLPPRTR